jgi:hypothetical protein
MKYLIIALLALLLTGKVWAQQPTPTPSLKPGRVTADYQRLTPPPSRPMQGWQVFQGATECTQVGGVLKCDNGLTMKTGSGTVGGK